MTAIAEANPWSPPRSVPVSPLTLKTGDRAEIHYCNASGSTSSRTVEVESLYTRGACSYLRAYCHLRGESRTFRTDRIRVCRLIARGAEVASPGDSGADGTGAEFPGPVRIGPGLREPETSPAPKPRSAGAPKSLPKTDWEHILEPTPPPPSLQKPAEAGSPAAPRTERSPGEAASAARRLRRRRRRRRRLLVLVILALSFYIRPQTQSSFFLMFGETDGAGRALDGILDAFDSVVLALGVRPPDRFDWRALPPSPGPAPRPTPRPAPQPSPRPTPPPPRPVPVVSARVVTPVDDPAMQVRVARSELPQGATDKMRQAYVLEHTGVMDPRLAAMARDMDENRNGELSWAELRTFQRWLYRTFAYQTNGLALRPDEFLDAGGGDCEDWVMVTSWVLRWWGIPSYKGTVESASGFHAITLIPTPFAPAGFRSFDINATWPDMADLPWIPVDYDHVGSLSNAVEGRFTLRRPTRPEQWYGQPI